MANELDFWVMNFDEENFALVDRYEIFGLLKHPYADAFYAYCTVWDMETYDEKVWIGRFDLDGNKTHDGIFYTERWGEYYPTWNPQLYMDNTGLYLQTDFTLMEISPYLTSKYWHKLISQVASRGFTRYNSNFYVAGIYGGPNLLMQPIPASSAGHVYDDGYMYFTRSTSSSYVGSVTAFNNHVWTAGGELRGWEFNVQQFDYVSIAGCTGVYTNIAIVDGRYGITCRESASNKDIVVMKYDFRFTPGSAEWLVTLRNPEPFSSNHTNAISALYDPEFDEAYVVMECREAVSPYAYRYLVWRLDGSTGQVKNARFIYAEIPGNAVGNLDTKGEVYLEAFGNSPSFVYKGALYFHFHGDVNYSADTGYVPHPIVGTINGMGHSSIVKMTLRSNVVGDTKYFTISEDIDLTGLVNVDATGHGIATGSTTPGFGYSYESTVDWPTFTAGWERGSTLSNTGVILGDGPRAYGYEGFYVQPTYTNYVAPQPAEPCTWANHGLWWTNCWYHFHYSVATDGIGNTYAEWDLGTLKIGDDGTPDWGRFLEWNSTGNGYIRFIAGRFSGGAIAAYESLGNDGNHYGIVKYDENGDLIWSSDIYQQATNPNDGYVRGRIYCARDESVYCVSEFFTRLDGSNSSTSCTFIIKFDSTTGSMVWAKRSALGGSYYYPDGRFIGEDSSGNIYLRLESYEGNTDDHIIKVSPSGNIIWAIKTPTVERRIKSGVIRPEFDRLFIASYFVNNSDSFCITEINISDGSFIKDIDVKIDTSVMAYFNAYDTLTMDLEGSLWSCGYYELVPGNRHNSDFIDSYGYGAVKINPTTFTVQQAYLAAPESFVYDTADDSIAPHAKGISMYTEYEDSDRNWATSIWRVQGGDVDYEISEPKELHASGNNYEYSNGFITYSPNNFVTEYLDYTGTTSPTTVSMSLSNMTELVFTNTSLTDFNNRDSVDLNKEWSDGCDTGYPDFPYTGDDITTVAEMYDTDFIGPDCSGCGVTWADKVNIKEI